MGLSGMNGLLKKLENVGIGSSIFFLVFGILFVNLYVKWNILFLVDKCVMGGSILKLSVVRNVMLVGVLVVVDGLVLFINFSG